MQKDNAPASSGELAVTGSVLCIQSWDDRMYVQVANIFANCDRISAILHSFSDFKFMGT